MRYDISRPPPSEAGELQLVHSLCAGVVPCIDPLPRVFASESFLMVHLAPMCGASLRSVSLFNVKSTQKTNIPICVHLHNVGMGGVSRFGHLSIESTYWRRISYPRMCHSSTASCHLCVLQMVCKWGTSTLSPSTATLSMSTSSLPSVPANSSIVPCTSVVSNICLSSKSRYVQLLDGGNVGGCCCLGCWCGCVV
jgi:hypothetical protein